MCRACSIFVLTAAAFVYVALSARAQVEIPLTFSPSDNRIGIQVSFLTSTPGVYTAPVPFMLDTGSPGFLVNQGVDVGASTQTGQQGLAGFGIGMVTGNPFNEYSGTLGLTDIDGSIHSVTTNFGQAFDGSFGGNNYPMGGTVNDDPIDTGGTTANGILGAGLTAGFYENNNFNLFSLINQIDPGPGLMPGFTVDLVSDAPKLTIGVTAEQIANFTTTVDLNATTSGPDSFPNTGFSTYNQKQINVDMTIGGTSYEATTGMGSGGDPTQIPTTLDTGAPDGKLLTGYNMDFDLTLPTAVPDESGGSVLEDTPIVVTNEDGDILYEFFTTAAGSAELKVEDGAAGPDPTTDAHFNSGIEPFLLNQITFVLGENAGDPGYVGFTVIPEPATGSLLLFGGAGYLLLRRRKR